MWYDIQNTLYEKGLLHGIEVVNGRTYYPNAHKWCLEKKMTMIGVSDIHGPINMSYNIAGGDHRPLTIAYAKERTEESLKEALFDRRTVIYWKDILIGEEKFLYPIYSQSVKIETPAIKLSGDRWQNVHISNKSEVPFKLEISGDNSLVESPGSINLYPNKKTMFRIRSKSKDTSGKKSIKLKYSVTNLYVAPLKGMEIELPIEATFVRANKNK